MRDQESQNLLPAPAQVLDRFVQPANRFFDWLYHSRFNPLYRSGTLATGLLVVLLVTGLYLLFFYSISEPYRSISTIQDQRFFGRWIRSVHRYATDAALIATFFHVLQLLVQGKTWGPRLLAWLSGVVLLGLLLISAWTGYVMVWDTHGQLLALAGARLLQVFPFLRDTLGQAFDGSTAVTQSFFFMNLFLHVAIPVGMIMFLWVHTAKLARSRWFPRRPIFITAVLGLVLLAVIRPANLFPEADLLRMIGRTPVDILYGFWIPLAERRPGLVFAVLVFGFVVLSIMPVLWRLKPEFVRPKSQVDLDACTGCTQCVRDCPYDAIVMEPRNDGKRLIARVFPESCVSCGICVASCADLAIGPPGRSGPEQLSAIRDRLANEWQSGDQHSVVVICCKHNGSALHHWRNFLEARPGSFLYPTDCCGSVHTQAMELMLSRLGGLVVHACPERNCFNRDALELSRQRVFFKRVPFLAREIERSRIAIAAASDSEQQELEDLFDNLKGTLKDSGVGKRPPRVRSYGQIARRIIATIGLFAVLPFLSEFPVGRDHQHGLLRVGVRIPGNVRRDCRQLTVAEQKALPRHMQKPEICDERSVAYRLQIQDAGQPVLEQTFTHLGIRGDSPLRVSAETILVPGQHDILVRVFPEASGDDEARSYEVRSMLEVRTGRIYLVTQGPTPGELRIVSSDNHGS